MRKIFFLFSFLLVLPLVVNAKEKLTKEQFCHFSYAIYKSCYMRGEKGENCGKLVSQMKVGEAFSRSQKEYLKEACKNGCFLGRLKLNLMTEDQFVNECSSLNF